MNPHNVTLIQPTPVKRPSRKRRLLTLTTLGLAGLIAGLLSA